MTTTHKIILTVVVVAALMLGISSHVALNAQYIAAHTFSFPSFFLSCAIVGLYFFLSLLGLTLALLRLWGKQETFEQWWETNYGNWEREASTFTMGTVSEAKKVASDAWTTRGNQ